MKLRHLFLIFIFGFALGQIDFTVADTVKRVGENAAETSYFETLLSRRGLNTFSLLTSTTGGVQITDDRIKTPILQLTPITSVDAADVLNYLPNGGVGLWVPTGGVSSADLAPFDAQDIETLRAAITSRGGAAIVVKQGDKLRSAALTDLTGLSNAEAARHNVVFRWSGVLYGANVRSL